MNTVCTGYIQTMGMRPVWSVKRSAFMSAWDSGGVPPRCAATLRTGLPALEVLHLDVSGNRAVNDATAIGRSILGPPTRDRLRDVTCFVAGCSLPRAVATTMGSRGVGAEGGCALCVTAT
jgi:hypothetical protein